MPPKRKLSASEASSSAGPTKKARSANVPTEPFHMSTRRRAKSAAPVAADEVATAEVEGGVVEERGVGEGVGEVAGAILAPVVEEEEGAGEGGGEVEEAVVEAAVEEEVGVGEGGDGVEVGGVEGDPGSVELAPSGPVTRGRGRGRGLAAPAAPATLAPTIRKRRGAYKAPKDNPVAVKLSARIDELNAVFRGVAKATKLVDDEIGKRTHEQLVTNPTLHEQLPQFGKLMEEMGVRWKAKRQAITAKYKLEVEQLKRRAEAEKHVINDMYEVKFSNAREEFHNRVENALDDEGLDDEEQIIILSMQVKLEEQARTHALFDPSPSHVRSLVEGDSTNEFKNDVAKHLGVPAAEIDNTAWEAGQRSQGKQPRGPTHHANKVGKPYSKPGFIKWSRTPAGKKQLAEGAIKRAARDVQFEKGWPTILRQLVKEVAEKEKAKKEKAEKGAAEKEEAGEEKPENEKPEDSKAEDSNTNPIS